MKSKILNYRLYTKTSDMSNLKFEPGAIARSLAMSLGNQEAVRSILTSGTYYREDLVMKIFLWPCFIFR